MYIKKLHVNGSTEQTIHPGVQSGDTLDQVAAFPLPVSSRVHRIQVLVCKSTVATHTEI